MFRHIDYDYLNDAINNSKYKLYQISDKLGISRVTMSHYRYGLNDMPSRHLVELVEILDLDIHKLLKMEEKVKCK